jgi:hypothetical protein
MRRRATATTRFNVSDVQDGVAPPLYSNSCSWCPGSEDSRKSVFPRMVSCRTTTCSSGCTSKRAENVSCATQLWVSCVCEHSRPYLKYHYLQPSEELALGYVWTNVCAPKRGDYNQFQQEGDGMKTSNSSKFSQCCKRASRRILICGG